MRPRVCRVLLLPLAVPPEVCGDPPGQAPGPLRLLPLQGTPRLFILYNSFRFPSFRLVSITFSLVVSLCFLPLPLSPFFSLLFSCHIPFFTFFNFLSFPLYPSFFLCFLIFSFLSLSFLILYIFYLHTFFIFTSIFSFLFL
jgi:hypothetical protein